VGILLIVWTARFYTRTGRTKQARSSRRRESHPAWEVFCNRGGAQCDYMIKKPGSESQP